MVDASKLARLVVANTIYSYSSGDYTNVQFALSEQ